MQNTLLIGLSRQTILERQLDVVANNVANVNTAGFKADHTLFEEYLSPGAHEDNFMRGDRRLSYVQDRGTFRDFSQGATDQTKNPLDVAIDGGGFLVVQTAGGERYTRDGGLQMNGQGQLVTSGGDPVLVEFQTVESVGQVDLVESVSIGQVPEELKQAGTLGFGVGSRQDHDRQRNADPS